MWGELIEVERQSEMDLIDLTKGFDVQGDMLFNEPAGQPADSSLNSRNFMDDMLMHTVSLLQYKRYALKAKDEPADIHRKQACLAKLPEMRKATSNFENSSSMTLNQSEIYSILRKVVALLAAHVGFQDAEAEALECMTDVTAMILEKLGQTLAECQKRRDLHLESSCQSAIEQTLSLSGISDVQVLFDYYDNRIRKYRDRLMTDCLKLQQTLLKEKSEED